MVNAWYMADCPDGDPTQEHHLNPPQFISIQELYNITGVLYYNVNPENKDDLVKIRKERGYSYEDEITCSKECLPNFEEKLKMFFQEHLHTHEEIRYVLEGSGYFDVRDDKDKWIRILVECGDLIIIPSGIYHRFTLDSKKYIRAKRLFIGEPIWVPHNRPAEELDCRREYLEKQEKKTFAQ